jgi:hypothetical protein
MGYTQAAGFAHEVALGTISLYTAIEYQLQHNHYPPVPSMMIPVAVKAVELAQAGDWDARVELPAGISYRGAAAVTVGALIGALHLEPFVSDSEEDV